MTALVEADVDGVKLDDDDILGFCALLLIAGNETTTKLLGNAVTVLAGHPDIRAEVVDDLSLAPATIEEVLRFEGPVPTLSRTTTVDVHIGDQMIGAGEKVLLLLAAANRDPRVFEDGERFDIHRRGAKHIEFGSGVHFCMGPTLLGSKRGSHSKNCCPGFPAIACRPSRCRTSTRRPFGVPRNCR